MRVRIEFDLPDDDPWVVEDSKGDDALDDTAETEIAEYVEQAWDGEHVTVSVVEPELVTEIGKHEAVDG